MMVNMYNLTYRSLKKITIRSFLNSAFILMRNLNLFYFKTETQKGLLVPLFSSQIHGVST